MTGWTPAFSAATRASNSGGDRPDPPLARPAARASMAARTTARGSGAPMPIDRPSRNMSWKAAVSPSIAVPLLAPSPVL